MSHPVVNISALKLNSFGPKDGSERFGASIGEIGEVIGSKGLGAMYVRVEQGKRAFPFHNHLAADEMFIILEGSGIYRFGDQEIPVKAGDVCAAPKGGPETAHQLINSGDSTLAYIGISTMPDPDIVEYPDSGKFSVTGIAPGLDFWSAHFRHIGRKSESYEYWDGEEG